MNFKQLSKIATLCTYGTLIGAVTKLAASPLDTRTQIAKAYRDEDSLIMRGDAAGAMAHYSKVFVGITPTGEIYTTYSALKNMTTQLLSLRQSATSTTKILSFKTIRHDYVEVKVKADSREIIIDPQTNQSHILLSHSIILDTLVFQAKRWLHQKSIILSSQATDNGRMVAL